MCHFTGNMGFGGKKHVLNEYGLLFMDRSSLGIYTTEKISGQSRLEGETLLGDLGSILLHWLIERTYSPILMQMRRFDP
jgi:hypothetical protein